MIAQKRLDRSAERMMWTAGGRAFGPQNRPGGEGASAAGGMPPPHDPPPSDPPPRTPPPDDPDEIAAAAAARDTARRRRERATWPTVLPLLPEGRGQDRQQRINARIHERQEVVRQVVDSSTDLRETHRTRAPRCGT